MATTQSFVVTGDEAVDHAAFEQFVGGPDRGFRLLRIYESSQPYRRWTFGPPEMTRAEVFIAKAKQAGYTEAEARALLSLQ